MSCSCPESTSRTRTRSPTERVEREALYTDNGAIRAFWRDTVDSDDLANQRVGHLTMSVWDSFQIKSKEDIWLIEQLLEHRRADRPLLPSAWADKDAGIGASLVAMTTNDKLCERPCSSSTITSN